MSKGRDRKGEGGICAQVFVIRAKISVVIPGERTQ
jgi:hypothetical protein